MSSDEEKSGQVEHLLHSPDLAGALGNEQFKTILDQMPFAIGVSRLDGTERVNYVNTAFERVTGLPAAAMKNRDWSVLEAEPHGKNTVLSIEEAIKGDHERAGIYVFRPHGAKQTIVAAYSNVILDDEGKPGFRLVALVDVSSHEEDGREELERRVREMDLLLKELQHRVKNNLQMITALIRLEARGHPSVESASFERLASRVSSLSILYDVLSRNGHADEIDLGAYLGQIASAVMQSHSREGISFSEELDTCPVSVNVAMPCGLALNELLINALKHAFPNGKEGEIKLQCKVDGEFCRIVIADNGGGLPPGETWPKSGKLGELIVQSLRENAGADINVLSEAGKGTSVAIAFRKQAA